MRRTAIGMLMAMAAMMATAEAQDIVVLAGNEGIVTAAELDIDGGFVRGGLISRQGGSEYDFMASVGVRHGDRVSLDLGLDVERMHPELREANADEPVDFRARIGWGVRVAERATALAEYSRSFHNETRAGRIMVGIRTAW